MRGSVEERLLQLVEKRRGLEALFRPGPSRSTSLGSRLLEDILKWGTTALFKADSAVAARAAAAAAGQCWRSVGR